MKNFVHDGDVIPYTNSGSAIASGDVVPLTNRIAVATGDIAATSGTGSLAVEGVFSLAKVTGSAFSAGDLLFYDAGQSKLTKTATGNTWAGYAVDAAASSDTSCKCSLEPSPKQVALQADTVAADLAALKVDFNALLAKMKAAGSMANS